MVIYRSIMVQLDLHEPIEKKVSFAWELANRFEADLIGLAASDIPVVPMVFATGAVVDTDLIVRQTEDIEARLSSLNEQFMTLVKDSDRASWRGWVGDPDHFLAQQARAADLLVVGRSEGGAGSVDVGEAVLAAGRPLLLPAQDMEPLQGRKIVVAWKDAREARRAVVDAMPFLVHAEDVLVTTVEEDDRKAAADSLADIVRFLIKHGVKARTHIVGEDGRSVGEALADCAFEFGADLLVSGGFGHSRLREWVLGGATRSLIADHRLNRLLSN